MSEIRKILIIEDDEQRIEEFTIHLAGVHEFQFASSAQYAIEKLLFHSDEPFDYIFLDHDLDEENTGKNGEGIDVVNFVVKDKFTAYRNAVFILHTMNPVGAENMEKVLKQAGFQVVKLPYSWIVWNKWKLNL